MEKCCAGLFALLIITGLSFIVRCTVNDDTESIYLQPSITAEPSNTDHEETKPIETVQEPVISQSQLTLSHVDSSSDPDSHQITLETQPSQSQSVSSIEVSESTTQDEITQEAEPVSPPSLVNEQNDASIVSTSQTPTESSSEIIDQPPAVESPMTRPTTNEETALHDVRLPNMHLSSETLPDSADEGTQATDDAKLAEDASKPSDDPQFTTFEEWSAQEKTKLEKEELSASHTNPSVAKVTKLNRNNYASMECGSKILATNPEAENSKSILNNNKDEYRINPCRTKNWFVVELCEPIQIQSLELASFELFSSQPHTFTVYLSDWYPPKEWRVLASFEATEERGVQSFQITDGKFSKYVKVEMVDHYGEEHYCPLTLFRVYGVALADEEDEDQHQKTDDVVPQASKDEPSNLFESAKDTVLSLVKKVLKVEDGNATNTAVDNSTTNSTEPDAEKPNITKDGIIFPCVPSVTIDEIRPSTTDSSANSEIPATSATDHPVPEHSIVTKLEDHEQPQFSQSQSSIQSHDHSSLQLITSRCCSCYKTENYLDSTKNIRSICLYIRTLLGGHKMSNCIRILKPAEAAILESSIPREKIVNTEKIQVADPISVTNVQNESISESNLQSNILHSTSANQNGASSVINIPQETTINSQNIAEHDDLHNEKPCKSQDILGLEPSVKTCKPATQSHKLPVINLESSENSVISNEILESTFIQLTTFIIDSSVTPVLTVDDVTNIRNPTPPQATIDTIITTEIPRTDESDMVKTTEISVVQTESVVVSTETSTETKTPELKIVKANVTKQLEDEQVSNLVYVPTNNAISKRETQMMRLSNRIKALELNVSLSSRFLEELSQRYRKKNEDLLKMLDNTTAKLLNATTSVSLKEQSHQLAMKNLESRVDDLDKIFTTLSDNMDTLRAEIRDRQIIWVTLEIIVAFLLFILYMYKQRPTNHEPLPVIEDSPITIAALTATPNRHQRNHSADEVINIQPGLTLKKRQSSTGALDTLHDTLHIIEPVSFYKDFGKPPDGLRKKKRKRSKQLFAGSHSDIAKLSDASSTTSNNEDKTHPSDRLQSEFSSAGLLFTADSNYQQKSPSLTVERSSILKKPTVDSKSSKNQHDTVTKKLSFGNGRKNGGILNNAKNNGNKNLPSPTLRFCNLESLPPLINGAHEKTTIHDKIRPAIKA